MFESAEYGFNLLIRRRSNDLTTCFLLECSGNSNRQRSQSTGIGDSSIHHGKIESRHLLSFLPAEKHEQALSTELGECGEIQWK